ncbi:MAG: tRNA (guanosine(37)-N1)-methyltransferase TrmD [Rhodospirillaceae bacterium]|nr:MAG: tRNA (guanosine(37)-N1)-methyltransferase TrmD [Rhodospirillaceae bacterium]
MTEDRNTWTAKVLTLFPEMFPGPLAHSLAGKALADEAWSLETVDIRDYATDRHGTVDDAPFGGGAGMVMRADVVDAAIEASTLTDAPLVYLTPRGERLSQAHAAEFAAGLGVTLICGRYEGIDQRVLEARDVTEISLGDFVLSGGEPAALALIDACVRLLPGVMGTEASLDEESFTRGLLEYPHYTRPADWCGRKVPDVLLSGHHENICAWRTEQAEIATRERRPDLWDRYQRDLKNQKEQCHERD